MSGARPVSPPTPPEVRREVPREAFRPAPQPASAPLTASRRGVLILAFAAISAGAAVGAAAGALAGALAGTSGLPGFGGTDARALLLAVALGWAALTLVGVLGLRLLWRPPAGFWDRPFLTLAPVARAGYDVTAGLTDAGMLGLAAGLGAAIGFDLGVIAMLGTALAVAAALALATGRDAEGLARAVAGLAPLGPALMAVASARTAVSVLETGAVQPYPWFPFWLAAALAVLGWLVVHRLGAERAARPVAMLWVGLPLAWLLVAALPGPLGPFDPGAEGETLSAAFAALDGRWPWGELQAIRGPWIDAGRALVGLLVLDPTRWGAVAGQQLILGPVLLAGNAALFAWLLGWRWLHAMLATLLACLLDPASGATLILWPPILAALALLLVRATVMRAMLLVGLAAAQVVLVPATIAAAGAVAVTVLLHDVLSGPAADRWRFRRSLLCAGWALPLAVAVVVGSVATDAGRLLLPLALDFDAAGIVDRLAAGGRGPAPNALATFGIVGAALAVIAAAAGWSALAGRRLDPRDWVMVAAGLFALSALPGVLGGDAVGLASAAVVPAAVVAVRLLTVLESASGRAMVGAAIPRLPAVRSPMILGALLVAVAGTAVWSRGTAVADPQTVLRRLRPTVVAAGAHPVLGYAGADVVDPAVLDGWRLLLEGWVAPGGRVLDLSGRPGLFQLLLGYRSTGRFLHAGLAFRPDDQAVLAAGLDRSKPEAVILPTVRDADGIPATVRLHRLSRAVLERYVPVEAFPDGVLLVPRGTELADPGLYARAVVCDWGDAAASPVLEPAAEAPRAWPARTVSGPETVTFRGRLPRAGADVELLVALLDGRPIADEIPKGTPAGDFVMTVQAPRGAGRQIRLAATASDGGLRPIAAGPAIEFEGGAGIEGPPVGAVESREIVTHDGVSLLDRLPVDRLARARLRLVVEDSGPGRRFRLGTRPPWSRSEPGEDIVFGSAAGGRLTVSVGACPQWWGYGDLPLFLWAEDGRPVPVAWELAPAAAGTR